MELRYFYQVNLPNQIGVFLLDEATSHHAIAVLRMQVGDALLLTNGNGRKAHAKLVVAHKKHAQVQLISIDNTPAPIAGITIAISLLKNKSRIEWLFEKLTEIGVRKIQLLQCERSEKEHYRADRMEAILVSAMLQSQQVWLPELVAPITVAQFVKTHQSEQRFIAHCAETEKVDLSNTRNTTLSGCLMIGPEGDFTLTEIEEASRAGYQPVSLGDTRLRTETAGFVGAVLMKY